MLPIPMIRQIIASIDTSRCVEFTIEANPEDVTPEWCHNIAETPIDRVSMGVQSFCDAELRSIGRRHSAACAIKAYHDLLRSGIDNISIDLMYGLPGQTPQSWQHSLDTALTRLHPSHLSAYLLSYEPRTRLSAMLDAGKAEECDPDQAAIYYNMLCDKAAAEGYRFYEISNLCLPGRMSRHNSSYWDSTPYIGVGPGAHSLSANEERAFNIPDVLRYISHGYEATLTPDPETPDNRFNDFLITRLRTDRGLSLRELRKRFGDSAVKKLLEDAKTAISAGHLRYRSDDSLVIPLEHRLITDTILLDLIR